MDALSVTHRLISRSSADSVKKLLQTFGVTNTSKVTLPIVFNPKYEAEWRTFIEESDFAAPDADSRLLYTILEFIRYMRYNRVNPFARKVADPVTKTALNPDKVYKRLVTEQLSQLVLESDKVVRRYNFQSVFTRKRIVVSVADTGKLYQVTSYSTLQPKVKVQLEQALSRLTGFSGKLPVQLQDKTVKGKSVLPTSSSLEQKEPQDWGWLVLTKTKSYVVSVRRSRDAVVLKVVVYLGKFIALGKPDEAKTYLAKTWKALKTSDKL